MQIRLMLAGLSLAWLCSCNNTHSTGLSRTGGQDSSDASGSVLGTGGSANGGRASGGTSGGGGSSSASLMASGGFASRGGSASATVAGTGGSSTRNSGGVTNSTGTRIRSSSPASSGGNWVNSGGTTSAGSASTGPVGCDRAGLTAAVDSYVAAVTAGSSTRMPLAASAKYVENGITTAFTDGVWKTPLTPDWHFNLIDTEKCGAFTYVISASGAHPYVLGTRIDVSAGQIAKVTAIAIDCDDHGFSASGFLKITQKQDMTPIPADQQYTHQELYDEASKYFKYWGDKTVVVPWGTNCNRLEGGAFNGPCNGSIPNGTAAPRASDWLADPEYGFCVLLLNMPGPDSHMFRITKSGGYDYIDTVTICYDSKHCYICPVNPPAIATCPADVIALGNTCPTKTIPDGGCVAYHMQGTSCGTCHQKSCTCETQDQNCLDIPRCASPDTPVDTPDGPRAIATLKVGDLVYSLDHGAVICVPIQKVQRMTRPADHKVVRVTLSTGSVIEMSAPHPTGDGRLFGHLGPGDRLGDVPIAAAELIPYAHPFTYDILPASDSGTYFVAGALVGSTMSPRCMAASKAAAGSGFRSAPKFLEGLR